MHRFRSLPLASFPLPLLLLLFALGLLGLPSPAPAAQVTETLTCTSGTATMVTDASPQSSLVEYSIAWTSDASTTAVLIPATQIQLRGQLVEVVTNPGATAPEDNYDLTLTDKDGLDVLGGGGANRDTATTEQFVPVVTNAATTIYQPPYVVGGFELKILNAGESKVGVVRFKVKVR